MRSSPITLRGVTWDHPRGHQPLAATARRYAESHPDVIVRWEKRSLRAFEAQPIESLAASYDLIVLDHPHVGQAAQAGLLLPLDEHLPAAFIADQQANSIGASYASYTFAGHQWALAIDTATPVAVWREDELERLGIVPPATWDELLALAGRGVVEIPAAPIYCLMNFYSLCLAHGGTPGASSDRLVDADAGCAALRSLRDLINRCDRGCWARNPIESHERLAQTDHPPAVYCPLAYGYSNYGRDGFAPHRLKFGTPPDCNDRQLCTTLGGTGLAISARTNAPRAALAYARFVASSETQRTLYTREGGQPGHRAAWLDDENNRLTNGFFRATLATHEAAYVRPRHEGALVFQEEAGAIVHAALRGTMEDDEAVTRLNTCFRESHAVV